jgi:hypothetical protein
MANLAVALVGEKNGRRGLPAASRTAARRSSTAARFRCGKGGEVGPERFSGWRESLPGGCSGRRMAGGVLPTVTRGGGGRVNGDGVASAGIRWRLGAGEHE